MKTLTRVSITMTMTAMMFATFLCSGQNISTAKLESQAPFTIGAINFQEWYAGINIGATGLNVFIPIATNNESVTIDKIYFRNLTGKLEKKEQKYVAVLKNTHKTYTFKKSERPKNYPFTIADHECVIGYLENGIRKYYKVKKMNEIGSVYYENGPPSLFLEASKTNMANLDSDEEDN